MAIKFLCGCLPRGVYCSVATTRERRWLMRAVGDTLRGIALACLIGMLVSASSAGAASPSPEYLALLEAAKAEGKATIGGFAFDPEEIATLEKGFKKRFGFPIKLTHDPTHIRDLPPKVIAGGFDVVELNVAGGAPDPGIATGAGAGRVVDVRS